MTGEDIKLIVTSAHLPRVKIVHETCGRETYVKANAEQELQLSAVLAAVSVHMEQCR